MIKTKYQLGQRIYHVLNGDDSVGIVTGILLRPAGVVYFVVWKDKLESAHYDFELSDEQVKDFAD